MRIISGSAGGIPIKVPGTVARPTTDQVREAVFSMLGEAVAGARVLDLFAGSGACGLEALSRGAQEVLFVEQNAKACAVILENLARSRLKGGQVLRAEAISALRRFAVQDRRFDLILADPPYAKQKGDTDFIGPLLATVELRRVLAPGGWLVVESRVTKAGGEAIPNWCIVRDRAYGSTRVLLLQLPTTSTDAKISGAPGLQSPVPDFSGGHDAGCLVQDEEARRPVE